MRGFYTKKNSFRCDGLIKVCTLGTKTEARGRKAHDDISREIIELCEVIWMHGQQTGPKCTSGQTCHSKLKLC